MRNLIVGGTSSLARALKPVLSEFSDVLSAGRSGCDVNLDLSDPTEEISLPDNLDVVIHTAAHFGGETFDEMVAAETVNRSGPLSVNRKGKPVLPRVQLWEEAMFVRSAGIALDAKTIYRGNHVKISRREDCMTVRTDEPMWIQTTHGFHINRPNKRLPKVRRKIGSVRETRKILETFPFLATGEIR